MGPQSCNPKQVVPPLLSQPTQESKFPNSPFQRENNLVILITDIKEYN